MARRTNSPCSDTLRLLSVLLDYPGDELPGALEAMSAAAAGLAEPEFKTAIQDFLAYLGRHGLPRLQENFTAAFDLQPATTLNLTYHAYGDNEQRAAALARLQHLYDQAGWERISGELPDYLPLLLEFLAIHPRPQTALPVWQCLSAATALADALEKTAPAYAALLRPLTRAAAAAVGSDNGRTSASA
ncbi:MAG TPA: nitrate reductase molybdenum cofactor assembly chaperone [Desulfobacterales bacterium]|jgi:nitrate reductase molybdenum cofactor assembly chaperone NarJ/NarW|nr:nitrate reductase molybdenum cofactor assembly chaperone [Desulfobacterales bacterium]